MNEEQVRALIADVSVACIWMESGIGDMLLGNRPLDEAYAKKVLSECARGKRALEALLAQAQPALTSILRDKEILDAKHILAATRDGCACDLCEAARASEMTADKMLDHIIGSLEGYPHAGGDIRVMAEVDRIVSETRASGAPTPERIFELVIERLWQRVGREEYGHAKAAVTLDIAAIEDLQKELAAGEGSQK